MFLDKVTPKLANRLIEIIDIRENNSFCYDAMLHGHDKRKDIIKPKTAPTTKPLTEEERLEIEAGIDHRLREAQN